MAGQAGGGNVPLDSAVGQRFNIDEVGHSNTEKGSERPRLNVLEPSHNVRGAEGSFALNVGGVEGSFAFMGDRGLFLTKR